MKTVFVIIAIIIVLFIILFFALGVFSARKTPTLNTAGVLPNCGETPNCVCSEVGTDSSHFVDPIRAAGADPTAIRGTLLDVIALTGGDILEAKSALIHATYTSKIFRFIDDVYFRIDHEARLIHIRSSSRVGHSDLGANRLRVAAIRDAYEKAVAGASGGN